MLERCRILMRRDAMLLYDPYDAGEWLYYDEYIGTGRLIP